MRYHTFSVAATRGAVDVRVPWISAPKLPVLRRELIGHLQKLPRSEQIEKLHRLDRTSAMGNVLDVVLGNELGITNPQGWPSPWLLMLCGNNILPISVVALLLSFQPVSHTSAQHCGLSQCHSG
jgi:hypothetical protein